MDLLAWLLLGAGLVGLSAGAEFLVRGAARLAATAGLSPLVIGLTVVAYGTSAPELAVSITAAIEGRVDLAVGNVVGSNIFNVLLILGLSALCMPLVVSAQVVRFDVPIMVGVSLLFWALALDGRLGRMDGLILVAGAVAYTGFLLRLSRREPAAVQEQYARRLDRPPSPGRASRLVVDLVLCGVGLGLLVVGTRWFVGGAVALARAAGVSELVIGLTIVAAGTSLPEAFTSVLATLRGERDIAVGNVVGSSIYNVLAVLGLSALLGPEGVQVAPAALAFDIPVMVVVAVACLPIFFTGHRIARWEGALFLGYYVAYVLYLVLAAQAHRALPMFSVVMMSYVVPLTVVTLTVLFVRAAGRRRAPGLDERR